MSQPTGGQPSKPAGQPGAAGNAKTGQSDTSVGKGAKPVTTSEPQKAELSPGQVLGQYRIVAKLGQGGMGAVYRAEQVHLKRPVALKVLTADSMKNPEMIARFQREMRAVGRIEHQNLVRALDAGQVGQAHYLAMEFVDGLDVAKILRKTGPLPIPEACEIIRQAALGLQAIDAHGMVHRDIKPSNLMLARQLTGPPVVKILDLGLARLTDTRVSGEQQLTQGHVIMGTLEYMAPEQAAHQAVDIRADIYSLGATLYALLTGKPPFSGPQYDTVLSKLRALAVEELTPIQELRPDIPDELASILERMLAKDPNERYSTPQEVAEVIQPFCVGSNLAPLLEGKLPARSPGGVGSVAPGQGFQVQQLSPSSALRRQHRQHMSKKVIVLIAILVPGAIGLLVLAALYWSSSRQSQASASKQPTKSAVSQLSTSPTHTSVSGQTKPSTTTPTTGKPKPPSPATKREEPLPRTWTVGRDVPTLEQAIASAQPSETIVLPAGHYRVPDRLVLDKSLTIRGAGSEQTFVTFSAAPVCVRITGSSVTIEELTLQYDGDLPADLLLVRGREVVLRNCRFRNAKAPPPPAPGQPPPPIGWGVKLEGEASCRVVFCSFEKTERGAVVVDHPGELVVEDTKVFDAWTGIASQSAGSVRLVRNRAQRCQVGIHILDWGRPWVEGNECLECTTGIWIHGDSSPTVQNNRCRLNREHGIAITSRAFPKIEENTSEENKASGIYVASNAQPILVRNVCRGNQQHGISILERANPTLRSNQCTENQGYGIYVGEQASVTLQDEQVLVGNAKGPMLRAQPAVAKKPDADNPKPPVDPPVPPKPPDAEPGAAVRTWTVGKDVPTLKEAVAKANARDIIVLPAGKYELEEGLILDKALQIQGASRDKTMIVCTAQDFVMKFVGDGPHTIEKISIAYVGRKGSSVVVVEGGTFTARDCAFGGGYRGRGLQDLGHGLDIVRAESVTLSQCLFANNERAGIRFNADQKGLVEACTVLECAEGVLISAGKCRIVKSTVQKCRKSGIVVTQSAEAEIEGCLIQGNQHTGIEVQEAAQAIVKTSKILANKRYGIAAYNRSVTNVESTTCSGNACGIVYTHESSGSSEKNICTSNLVGIAVGPILDFGVEGGFVPKPFGGFRLPGQQTRVNVEGNVCSQNRQHGIIVGGEARPTIRDNVCELNGGSGIHVGDRAQPNIRGNQCIRNRMFGIYVSRTAEPDLGLDNKLSENGAGPINPRQ